MSMVQRKVENVDWKEVGQNVQGKLLAADKVKFRDGGTNVQYCVRTASGTVKVFRGATQLNHMLNRDDIGQHVSIKYLGEDESREVREVQNRAKLFEVYVDDAKPVTAPSGEGITDDDIPF